jgi:hypothetical protein
MTRVALPLPLLVAVTLLAGCGGGGAAHTTRTSTPGGGLAAPAAAMDALIASGHALPGTVRTLFEGSGWAVVQSTAGAKASARVFRLVHGRWRPEQSSTVRIAILGPEPGAHAPALPQVAMEVSARQPFVESALWLDGKELLEKGGGSPTNGTIYGAPAHTLKPGFHVAVGYARTARAGATVAWTFQVS